MRIARATAFLVSLVVVLGAAPASVVRAGSQPDIVVVMIDDMGAGPAQRVLERLPTIKRLFLDEGLRFLEAYGETPLCCPGRASFLTGQHTRHHGVTRNRAVLLDPSRTIATALSDAGYRTLMAGKYLNKSFQLNDFTPPGWDRVAMPVGASETEGSQWRIEGRLVDRPEIWTDVARGKMVKWIRSAVGAPVERPIFAWFSAPEPHRTGSSLLPRPARYDGDPRCAGIARWSTPAYQFARYPHGWPLVPVCEALLVVDEAVAAIEQELAGRDVLWVLMSDNGMSWGSHGVALKNSPWSTALPFYVHWRATGAEDGLISNIDIGPTLAEMGDATMPWADGVSFSDALTRDRFDGRDEMLEDHPVGGIDYDEDGRYTVGPWSALRTPTWRYLEWADGTAALFDLQDDPWELIDVKGKNPLRTHLMAQRLHELTQ